MTQTPQNRLARRLRRLCAPALLLTAAATVQAAPTLLLDGTTLIGARGVEVFGTLYDVEFDDGSCGQVFTPCAPAGFFGGGNVNFAL